MRFDPELAAIRFGCGLSPTIAPPGAPDDMLRALLAEDDVARRFPVESFGQFNNRLKYQIELRKLERQAKTDADRDEAREGQRLLRRRTSEEALGWLRSTLLRRTWTTAPLRERLVQFWGDHFTATGKTGALRSARLAYLESAIRPNVALRFDELLVSAVTHPLMLHYLDQDTSAGPESRAAQNNNGRRGLNENLAREILELHTLGVGGPYTQGDVTELARLLAGLTFNAQRGTHFQPNMADPGTKTVLGVTYGTRGDGLTDIAAVLQHLALHEVTAAHLARKLATHFVSDTPTEALIGAMTDRYMATGGALTEVYRAMLEHPDSWDPAPGNVKQPLDLMGSAFRALGTRPDDLNGLNLNRTRSLILAPMTLMGQDIANPPGPQGLPEADSAWVSPQGIAARLQWAVGVPQIVMAELPDPRDFARTALGSRATPAVRFAAEAAETRWEGVGLVLASPAFQTM